MRFLGSVPICSQVVKLPNEPESNQAIVSQQGVIFFFRALSRGLLARWLQHKGPHLTVRNEFILEIGYRFLSFTRYLTNICQVRD